MYNDDEEQDGNEYRRERQQLVAGEFEAHRKWWQLLDGYGQGQGEDEESFINDPDEPSEEHWDEGLGVTEDDDPEGQSPAERDDEPRTLPVLAEIPEVVASAPAPAKPKTKTKGPKKSRLKPRPETKRSAAKRVTKKVGRKKSKKR